MKRRRSGNSTIDTIIRKQSRTFQGFEKYGFSPRPTTLINISNEKTKIQLMFTV
jgi:hypothetical protein